MTIRRSSAGLLAAAVSVALLLPGCASSVGPGPAGSPSAAPGSSSAGSSAAASQAASPTASASPPGSTPAPGSSAPPLGSAHLQPLWPFTTLAEAQAWEASYRSGGHQPWHLDPDRTALSFTQGFLGFGELGRVSSHTVNGRDAHIGVGLSTGEGSGATAAVIHLVRYGTDPDAPWEVVGTDDTSLSLTTPAYGAVVHSPAQVGGRITGVDESIRVEVRRPAVQAALGNSCCTSAGGSNEPWHTAVSFSAPSDSVLTVVAATGGHVAGVERFAVTAVRTG